MTTTATRPKPGTDSALMLDDLIAHYPDPAWALNSRLGITAHSRASNLRDLGWDVESVSRPNPANPRKRLYGYKLVSAPPEHLPTPEYQHDENGQFRITA